MWRSIIEKIKLTVSGRAQLRSSDSGVFDPFLPIGVIKGNDESTNFDQVADDADPFFGEQVLPKRSFSLFQAIVYIVALSLCFRLVFLQISQGQANYLLAEGNRLKTEPIPAPRGLVYDRNGVSLVKNVPSFSVIMNPNDVPRKSAEKEAYLTKIAAALSIDKSSLADQVTKGAKKESITLLEGLDRDRALSAELRLDGADGVEVVKTPTRLYSDLAGLGHIIGYIGKVTADDLKQRSELLPTSYLGKAGLEKSYDSYLQGKTGIETLEVDSLGRKIRSVGVQPAQSGQSLVLNIDSGVQTVAAQALSDAIVKNKATSGAAIAMDPRTGGILAMVSFPLFNNNIFSPSGNQEQRQAVLNDPLSPLINRAIAGQYPSGSTIKPFVATAGLQEKVITPSTKIDTSEGKITIGQWTFVDWKTHGVADVKQAIAESNNIFFYTVGGGHGSIGGLGAERLANYLEKFGFGSSTGIDIPGENDGLVPRPEWKKKVKKESWYIGDTYNLSIGQGDLLVTPLQLVRATSAVANGGTLYEPRLVKSILSSTQESTQDIAAKVDHDHIADADTLQVVRDGMRQTVLSGSARSFNVLPVEVAAKTGTAQFDLAKEKTHSWFTSFAPYRNPEIAVSVIVEGGGEGYSVAAPVAKQIIEQYFHLPLTPIVSATPNE